MATLLGNRKLQLPPMNFACLLVAVAISLVACGPRVGTVTGGTESPPYQSGAISSSDRGVVVFPAYLRSRPGSGARLGEIQPGAVVRLGDSSNDWREIEVLGPTKVTGWLRQDRLGCRALRDTELRPLDGGRGQVRLRPGALLALRGEREGRLEVETRDAVSRRGTIETESCGVGEPFVPTFPRGAIPHRLLRDAEMVSSEEDGREVIRLPEGYRFAVASTEGRAVVGWTDGPVVVAGQVDARAVERDRSTPLDRLAEPLGYTHEALVDLELRSEPSGTNIASLAGGVPLNRIEQSSGWIRVRTHGAVQLEGWVEHWEIRRVALDHNELEPWARRRLHVPIDRSQPRGMDLVE